MRTQALRDVLLVKAVEESDTTGAVLPIADRDEATRTAARALGDSPRAAPAGAGRLDAGTERFLEQRATRLRARLAARHAIVAHVLRIADRLARPGFIVVACAVVAGLGLASLDAARRIEILAFPLAGLVAWNLAVYAVLLLSHRSRTGGDARPLARVVQALSAWRLDRWLRRSSFYDAALAAALRRFAGEWAPAARTLLARRTALVLHAGAAALAAGLVAGLYARGIVFRYEAGWESTFLRASQVHALLQAVYGPAAALTGIPLPRDAAAVEALRWQPGRPGAEAAPWIHLIAVTALLYIVIPRLVLAAWAATALWRLERRAPLPPGLAPYARSLLGGMPGAAVSGNVLIVPNAYTPAPAARDALDRLLADALGLGRTQPTGTTAVGTMAGGTTAGDTQAADQPADAPAIVRWHAPVRYGDEAAARFATARAVAGLDVPGGSLEPPPADASAAPLAIDAATTCCVALFSLAATPEDESHGELVTALRDAALHAASRPAVLLVADEGPYAARMRGDASFEARLTERRALWRRFAARHGLRACTLDLASLAGRAATRDEIDAVRRALASVVE